MGPYAFIVLIWFQFVVFHNLIDVSSEPLANNTLWFESTKESMNCILSMFFLIFRLTDSIFWLCCHSIHWPIIHLKVMIMIVLSFESLAKYPFERRTNEEIPLAWPIDSIFIALEYGSVIMIPLFKPTTNWSKDKWLEELRLAVGMGNGEIRIFDFLR